MAMRSAYNRPTSISSSSTWSIADLRWWWHTQTHCSNHPSLDSRQATTSSFFQVLFIINPAWNN